MLQGPIPIEFGRFFPDGAYIAGPIEKLRDFDRSKGDRIVQQLDKNTGLPLWTVDVIDADPQARQRTVKVKVAAEVRRCCLRRCPGRRLRRWSSPG